MKITIESTTKTVELNGGLFARIWEGRTDSGIEVHCLITRIAVHKDLDQAQFVAELQEQRTPSFEVGRAYPSRLIL